MGRNPIIAFALIASVGIMLMFGASFFGLHQAEIAAQDENGEGGAVAEAATPEENYAQSCAACHGQNLEGGAGPALDQIGGKLDAAQIHDVIANGQGIMPGNLVTGAQAEELAAWLAEKK